MKSWEPNKLVQDDQDVAYQPIDKLGKQIATRLTLELRLIMHRAAVDARKPQAIVPRRRSEPTE